jgi:hypothetical protein
LIKEKGDHLRSYKRNDDKNKKYFYNALRKHGPHNFKWIVLGEIFTNSKEELKNLLNDAEIESITLFQTYNNLYGYNMTIGGDGCSGYHHTEESCNKIKDKHHLKNKTYLEVYGEEKAKEINNKKVIRTKDKTYEQIMGEDKAKILKEKRSKAQKGKIITEEQKRKNRETKKYKLDLKYNLTLIKFCIDILLKESNFREISERYNLSQSMLVRYIKQEDYNSYLIIKNRILHTSFVKKKKGDKK